MREIITVMRKIDGKTKNCDLSQLEVVILVLKVRGKKMDWS